MFWATGTSAPCGWGPALLDTAMGLRVGRARVSPACAVRWAPLGTPGSEYQDHVRRWKRACVHSSAQGSARSKQPVNTCSITVLL